MALKPKVAPKLNAGKAKSEAKAAPKLAGKGKATKAAPKPKGKGEKVPTYDVGATLEFAGYSQEQENPIFTEGDRVLVVEKGKDDEQKTFYTIIAPGDKAAYDEDPESVNGDQVYAEELRKAPKVEVDPYALEIVHVEALDKVLEENGGDPLQAANYLQNAVVTNTLYLGGAIAELYKGQKFREYGDYADEEVDGKAKAGSGWDKFCQDNLGISGRKAFGLITIYSNYAKLNEVIDLDEVFSDKKIGWVKLEYAASVINEKNAAEIIEAAKEQSVSDFKSTITTDYKSADGGTRSGGPKIKRVTLKAAFFEDQADGVTYVLEQAQKQFGFSNIENTLEAIILQWAAQNLNESQNAKASQLKRKKQTELKKAGVDLTDVKERDAALEAVITGGEDGDEE
jgi:hypothetical protein